MLHTIWDTHQRTNSQAIPDLQILRINFSAHAYDLQPSVLRHHGNLMGRISWMKLQALQHHVQQAARSPTNPVQPYVSLGYLGRSKITTMR